MAGLKGMMPPLPPPGGAPRGPLPMPMRGPLPMPPPPLPKAPPRPLAKAPARAPAKGAPPKGVPKVGIMIVVGKHEAAKGSSKKK